MPAMSGQSIHRGQSSFRTLQTPAYSKRGLSNLSRKFLNLDAVKLINVAQDVKLSGVKSRLTLSSPN
jgi:hypothetical protein